MNKSVTEKLIISTCLLLFMNIAWVQQSNAYDDRPKITVNGEAVVNVSPDKSVITFGLETSDQDILVARQTNYSILRKTLQEIQAPGISEKKIQACVTVTSAFDE